MYAFLVQCVPIGMRYSVAVGSGVEDGGDGSESDGDGDDDSTVMVIIYLC